MRITIFLGVVALCGIALAKHHKHRVPVIDLHGADLLVATIREGEPVVNTVPELGIVSESGPICKYVLSNVPTTNTAEIPFEIDVVERDNGNSIIRVKDGASLDCSHAEYNLSVAAVRCDDESSRSESVVLKISVKDTNNHAPEFDNPWYSFDAPEGKIIDEIGKITALDKDCGHPYGEICEYSITNGLHPLPFSISKQGIIRTTSPLNYTDTRSYILTVTAHDCGMRKSKTTLVTINVQEACQPRVQASEERVHYVAGSGSKLLLPGLNVVTCAKDSKCEVSSIEGTVELNAGHVTVGCSRDTVFTNESIQRCGLSADTKDLLPEMSEAALKSTEGFTFDGEKNAIVVKDGITTGLIPDTFTLSFYMKHARGSKNQQNNKQNILCESDESSMNRHHFSVYVRHCKLEVVLRREAGAAAEFRAAEWRWAMPQVCDDKFHAYSLLFNGVDDVHLMVDGNRFAADERNPEILDDWPLHKTNLSKTKLVIGACWHGRQQQMAQHFAGVIGSMHLLSGTKESEAAIECAHKCPEQLHYTGIDELKDGQQATFSNDLTTVKLKAGSAKELEEMLRQVAYANTHVKPTLGHRSWTVTTRMTCKEGYDVTLPAARGYIFVQHEADPVLSLSGSAVITTDQHAAKVGTPMIPDIQITVSQTGAEGQVKDVTSLYKLDYCKVHLKPSRDMDMEYFSSPATLITELDIDFEHDKEGVLLKGEESVHNYAKVLQKIHYFNTRPESYAKRIYTVQCALMKGKILSNELMVTMTIEPSHDSSASLDASTSSEALDTMDLMDRHFELAFDQLGSNRLQNILEMDLPRPKALLHHEAGQGAVAGGAVAVVVVVCVGFLLVLLVIGVLKMRDTPLPRKRKHRKQDDGLHWDDSGMNITVNPLDDVEKNGAGAEEEFTDDEDSSDGESECSYHDDEEEVSDEEGTEVLPHLEGAQRSGLEWDDESALAATNARSYRV